VFDLWTDLLDCLDLHRARGPDDADGVTSFDGVSQQLDYHRVFGGQLLGQFIQPASLPAPGSRSSPCVPCSHAKAVPPNRFATGRRASTKAVRLPR
jgi:acyl-CoA thioesterase-2